MQLDEEFSALLGVLYEGPMEQPLWHSFLSRVRELLGADLVTLLLRPPSEKDQVEMLADGGSLSAIKSYNEGQFALDPFVDLPSHEVVTLQEYLPGDALQDSDFYRIILEPQGWFDFLGVDIRSDNELDVRFRVGRYRGAPAFAGEEKTLVRTLLPHLERAIRLQSRINRIEREKAAYAGAMAQLSVATIILDERQRVVSVNEAAERLLQDDSGLRLREGNLVPGDVAARRELQALLADVLAPQHGSGPAAVRAMQLPRGSRGPALGLVVKSLPGGGAHGRATPRIAVFLSDPLQAAEPPDRVISRLFDFTPAEARLATLLTNGLSLDEASAELGVSRNTARTHLRAMFAKTGVARQAGLVRLIMNSVAPLAGAEVE